MNAVVLPFPDSFSTAIDVTVGFTNDKAPEPSVFNIWFAEPSLVGNVRPFIVDRVIPADDIDILPVDEPVAVVVPKANVSFDSSQIKAALLPVEPLSKTNPKSFEFDEAPEFNSINGSETVVFVDDTAVVVPDTVKLPVAVILPLSSIILANSLFLVVILLFISFDYLQYRKFTKRSN